MARKIDYIGSINKPKKKQKRNANKPFYNSKHWKSLRLVKLSLEPVCERCNETFANHVHHIKEVSDYPELKLVLDNLEALCRSCHSKHHADEQKKIKKPTLPIWEGDK